MTNDIFKTNQAYISEFFALTGGTPRGSITARVIARDGKKPGEGPSNAQKIKAFKQKTRRSLKSGLRLPLEELAAKHKLHFTEKALLAAFAGAELYRLRVDAGELISRFENKGLAPAFETLQHLTPGSSALFKKKLIIITMRENIMRYGEEITLPPGVFSRITGISITGKKKKTPRPSKVLNSPAKIYERLSSYVVGQEEAKKAVSAGVFLHFKRTELNTKRRGNQKIPKSNILIIGPTGSGKTHICRTLAAELNVPFNITDATQYSETGYVGRNVEEMVLDLFNDKDPGPKPKGIIYLDEVDKISAQNIGAGHYTQRDVSGKSVQEELLKLLEGGEVTCERPRSFSRPMKIDISGVMFIAGGAFQGLEDIIEERLRKRSIGFCGSSSGEKLDRQELLRQVTPEDLIAYGFMPEFIGRFPVIAVLNRLTKEDMVNIITGTQNSLLSQYQAVIEQCGLNIQITTGMVERVAEEALSRNLGARAIRGIMEKWLTEEIFKAESRAHPAAERQA